MISKTSTRRGFTIVELLVAMALIILIMAVLSEAFVSGLGAFRSLKSIGDMQERLRVASIKLRADLALRHFEDRRMLSDIDPYWQDPFIGSGDQNNRNVGGRPAQGFLRIQTPPGTVQALSSNGMPYFPSVVLEGVDGDGIQSWITTPSFALPANRAMLPVLHFASKLVPDRKDVLRRDQLYITPVPPSTTAGNSLIDLNEGPPDFRQPGLLNSPWAEIAWFLVPTGETAGSQGVTPLYSLYRRQRILIAPRRDSFLATPPAQGGGAVAPAQIGQYYGVSVEPDPTPGNNLLLWNSEYSVAGQPYAGFPAGRSMSTVLPNGAWWSTPTPVGTTNGEPATLIGDDLVTTDVISFEIKVLRPNDAAFRDLNDWFTDGGGNQVQPFGGIYDTATAPQGWLSLRAIKVTIRVWDFKTQLARQITVIQDL
jgi:prepilin-type N-terminal cleavage/methylation domain-containing protein